MKINYFAFATGILQILSCIEGLIKKNYKMAVVFLLYGICTTLLLISLKGEQ